MGGHGAYLYASQLAPGRFSAVAVMCAYLDEDNPFVDAVPAAVSAVVEPLKSTPIWIFHSEQDDSVPPPGRPQDDSEMVVKAFEAAGNTAIKHTRYPAGVKPPNYIPGHAAFEFAFHDAGMWPWLSAQKRRAAAPMTPFEIFGALVGLASVAFAAVGVRLRRVAYAVSCVALVCSSVAFLGLMQAEGGLFDSCYSYSFVDVSVDQCREIGAAIVGSGELEKGWLALAISKVTLTLTPTPAPTPALTLIPTLTPALPLPLPLPYPQARAENCFALGMGIGALYSLLFLDKGTKEVAVVHLMHAGWALSVCAANAQNAGMLGVLGVPAEANIDPASSAR